MAKQPAVQNWCDEHGLNASCGALHRRPPCVNCGDELARVEGGRWYHLTGDTHCEAPEPEEGV